MFLSIDQFPLVLIFLSEDKDFDVIEISFNLL